MADFKEKLKNIDNISQDYAPIDLELVERAKARSMEKNAEMQAKTIKVKMPFWKKLALGVSLLSIAFCSVFFPIYYSNLPDQPIYYSDKVLSAVSEQSEIDSKLSDVNFEIFAESVNYTVMNQLFVETETQKLCYFYQYSIDLIFGDTVNLYVELAKNATFEFETYFDKCKLITEISNVNVNYVIVSGVENNIFAKFTYDSHDYFIKVTYVTDALSRLEYHLTQLLND
ncbi:MAG: hypothetical protein IJX03_00275 [Clostridia bacterium]|nr:hypothetical protein [Clostridia bacterium]